MSGPLLSHSISSAPRATGHAPHALAHHSEDAPCGWPRAWPLLIVLVAVLTMVGCARTRYRLQADRDVTGLVQEKSNDQRWAIPAGFNLQIDPRSRYYDPNDPDRTPMPPDDPAAHVYMHNVAGKKGYKLWHRWGDQARLENPEWYAMIGQYTPVTPDGKIKLDLEGAVQLGYIHSPDYRTQLETLYLSALDVSTERFRFMTQFYGGLGASYTAAGAVASSSGNDSTLLTAGTGAGALSGFGIAGVNTGNDPTRLTFQRNFATGGQAVVTFANSFVWQFTGGEQNTTSSLINFNIIQPLLRAGGRAVALEQLTIVERNLLGNLRSIQRYRQGFFTNVAVGYFVVNGPQRQGGFQGGTGLTGFSGQGAGGLGGVGGATNFGRAGFGAATAGGGGAAAGAGFAGGGVGQVGGFIGLLQQRQQLRNTEDSLNLQLRTLKLLEANLAAGVIDITQVDIFRQNIETERANLLNAQINYQNTLDTFKRQILGLPPHLPVEIDESMIEQFLFIDRDTRSLENDLSDFIEQIGTDDDKDPTVQQLLEGSDRLAAMRERVEKCLAEVDDDLRKLDLATPGRLKLMQPEEAPRLEEEKTKLRDAYNTLVARFEGSVGTMKNYRGTVNEDNRGKSADTLVALAMQLLRGIQELSLVQVRARLESIVVDPISLESTQALEIARQNRLDWMNNRLTVVNTWRLITYNANALRSNFSVQFSGNYGTIRNNMVSFDPSNGSLTASIRLDPPITRLLERNNYRQSLISYQQDRRTLIQFEDGVNQTLRQDIRSVKQFLVNLEIQRRAVAIAVRRVDKTLEDLNQPPPAVQPGQQDAPQLGPTAALNLLTAISDLRNAQNNFMGVWLNYYSERMELEQDLGIMQLDERGIWIDRPFDELIASLVPVEVEPLPPPVPDEWLRDAGIDPHKPPEAQAEPLPMPKTKGAMEELPKKPVPPPPAPKLTPTQGSSNSADRLHFKHWFKMFRPAEPRPAREQEILLVQGTEEAGQHGDANPNGASKSGANAIYDYSMSSAVRLAPSAPRRLPDLTDETDKTIRRLKPIEPPATESKPAADSKPSAESKSVSQQPDESATDGKNVIRLARRPAAAK
ncbi:MAG: hypothetical protein JSS27_15320 [Planctomycetes bacterium]|nr:hypothetical protein [Planctomycetota bacterium]